ncbi:MAG: hypothetical protein AB7V27_17995 [Candidatus Binatia bacterium]
MRRALLALCRLPVDDCAAAFTAALSGPAVLPRAALMLAALLLSWWVYVPVHELLHVLGCVLGGGTVTRLELDSIYGAAWLQRVFPFVSVGSDYAGQLTGFDTGGSDLTYLLTDWLPFALTIAIGVPLLRFTVRMRPGLRQAALVGIAIPIAWAPLSCLPGDFYEMGSIAVSRVSAWVLPHADLQRWRSDDVFRKAQQLMATDGEIGDIAGVGASLAVGAILALLTYAGGVWWSKVVYGVARSPAGRVWFTRGA